MVNEVIKGGLPTERWRPRIWEIKTRLMLVNRHFPKKHESTFNEVKIQSQHTCQCF